MISIKTRTTLIIAIFSVIGFTVPAGVSQTAFAQSGSTDNELSGILECIESHVDTDNDLSGILECIESHVDTDNDLSGILGILECIESHVDTDNDLSGILECIESHVEG